MIYKRLLWRFILLASMVTASVCAVTLLIVFGYYTVMVIALAMLLWAWTVFYNYQMQLHREVQLFNESVRYHDFSRHFNEGSSAGEWRPLRRSFNEVFSVIKTISKEKEKHYQYLLKILELVDTGIISFDTHSGEVVWINESLKKLLVLPNIKTIDGLSRRHPGLYDEIRRIEPGKQSIASFGIDRSVVKILMAATLFEIDGRTYKVIAIQNIQEALDETESRAWQKLLSVLTHEIMNSVAPISSVAKTLNDLMMENEESQGDPLPVDDIRTGLATIKRRSEGLLRFSETYRNLSKITSLNVQSVSVNELFNNIVVLMRPSMQQKKISLTTQLESHDMEIQADPNLVEQVLINLVMNATEAVKDRADARILLTARHDGGGKMQLSVSDNGSGIAPGLMENIFIPFFSTRKNGTGIGLSLCKQIMLLHKGNIVVRSVEGAGSSFILQFS